VLRSPGRDDVVERVEPLSGLVRVDVRQLAGQAVADDRKALASRGHELFLAFPRSGTANWPPPPLVLSDQAALRHPVHRFLPSIVILASECPERIPTGR